MPRGEGKPQNLRRNAEWRKWIGSYREGVGRGVGCMGAPLGLGVTRDFRENSGNCLENSREFPGFRGGSGHSKSCCETAIFTIGQKKNNPTIMPDPPTEYLRNCNLPQIRRFSLVPSFELMCYRVVKSRKQDGGDKKLNTTHR